MKKALILSYIALLIAVFLPRAADMATAAPASLPPDMPPAAQTAPVPEETDRSDCGHADLPASPDVTESEADTLSVSDAPQYINVLIDGVSTCMDMQDYLIGVVAAEMPVSFEPQALRAQAVAARTYAMHCMADAKHGDADVCTDHTCCQAWQSDGALAEKWGADYESCRARIAEAVDATRGLYLSYGGEAAVAVFHSSSAGETESSAAIWNGVPYLVSVPSPETAEDVPNYITAAEYSPIDFRDTVLSAYPNADFTAAPSEWIGELTRDESGRVAAVILGGEAVSGTELRRLFSLRSTAFELSYNGQSFCFTVVGFGHGIGMSQYGANVMARCGSGFEDILAHYYPGTQLLTAA